MSPDKILVVVIGVLGIVFTYWFFLMKRTKEISVQGEVEIIVDGGYTPEVISIPKDQTTKISFLRKDPSSCLEEVVLADFKMRKFLPLNQQVSVEITPLKEGEYNFTCGMNMFHGKIIAR